MLEHKEIEYEKVVLVGLITKLQDEEKAQEYLEKSLSINNNKPLRILINNRCLELILKLELLSFSLFNHPILSTDLFVNETAVKRIR